MNGPSKYNYLMISMLLLGHTFLLDLIGEINMISFQVQFGTNQSHFGNKQVHNEIAKFRIGHSKFKMG